MAKEESASGFSNVDRAVNPDALVHYLDSATALDFVQMQKRRIFELLKVREGQQLLDVGCGTGDDVRALARMVGNTGRVVGIDNSETMVTEARKRVEGLNLPVEYYLGDAQHLEFADNTFDGCRAERIFVHLSNPRQALAELIRVARPGAQIVVCDPDFETLIIDAGDQVLTRKFLNFCCHTVRNGWMGRQLPRLFTEAKLHELTIAADTLMLKDYGVANQLLRLWETAKLAQEAGVASATEITAWMSQLEQAHKAGYFFLAMTFFCVSGQK